MPTKKANNAAFRNWLREIDDLCLAKLGVSLDDLPDLLTRDAFEAGTTPEEFFAEDVVELAREEFGSLVDEL